MSARKKAPQHNSDVTESKNWGDHFNKRPNEHDLMPRHLRPGSQVATHTPATAPDWPYWPGYLSVSREEAIFLSLGIDPNSMHRDEEGHINRFFTDAATRELFNKRLGMLERCHTASSIRLSIFAKWAVSVAQWQDLPPALEALATKPTATPAPVAAVEPEKIVTDEKVKAAKLTETRVATILNIAKELGYEPLAIPYGGKARIGRECTSRYTGEPNRFTADTFKTAWQAARDAKRIDVQNVETYRRR